MNKSEIKEIIDNIMSLMPNSVNGADKADIFAFLAVELELTHLLIPEAAPTIENQIEIPIKAPELYQKRKDKSERPCEFIIRVYKQWHGVGLARHHLLELDKPLYHALCCWLSKNEIPDWLDLPTKKEVNDRELRELGLQEGDTLAYPSYYQGLKTKLRLYNAARNRKG